MRTPGEKFGSTRKILPTILLCALAKAPAWGDVTNIPALNSRPGADYTIYLDFGGFTYTGTWNGYSPGTTPAWAGQTTSFTASQIKNLTIVWARVAEAYAPFDINVTTVDPAVAGLAAEGLAYTDANRQTYYDSTVRLMHTIVGGKGTWYSSNQSGAYDLGTSYIGVASHTTTLYPGEHTNWVFEAAIGSLAGVADVTSHEDGHSLGLYHQSDVTPHAPVSAEYSTNGGASGVGSYAPIMGHPSAAQRATFRTGYSLDTGQWQNDAQIIDGNLGMQIQDAGVGHSSTPTPLPLNGSAVDPTRAIGVIRPTSFYSPNPIGSSNYTVDDYQFATDGSPITLTLEDGSDWITPGTPDGGATLEGLLTILDADGSVVANGTLSADTYSDTFSGTLTAGIYYAQISSNGGYQSTYDPSAEYFSMGDYFLTGSGFVAVPEPESMLLSAVMLTLLRRRRG